MDKKRDVSICKVQFSPNTTHPNPKKKKQLASRENYFYVAYLYQKIALDSLGDVCFIPTAVWIETLLKTDIQ